MTIAHVVDGETELDSALFNPWVDHMNGLQTGALPIALAGIEGALGEYGPLVRADTRVFDLRKFGVTCNGVTDDTIKFQDAWDEVSSLGGGVLVAPAQHRVLVSGRLVPRRGVSLDFQGSTLLSAVSGDPIISQYPGSQWATNSYATITANVAENDTSFTVDSSAAFTVGDEIMVRLVENGYDSAEAKFSWFGMVTAIADSSHLTIDVASPSAMVVGGTAAINRRIYLLDDPIRDIFIRNMRIENHGGNPDRMIFAAYWRNCTVQNIVGYDTGSGVINSYHSKDLYYDNISCLYSPLRGNASKGRALTISNTENLRVGTVTAENFEGSPIYVESHSRGLVFDVVHLKNTNANRNQSSTPLIMLNSESDAQFGNILVEGAGGTSLISEGLQPGLSHWSIGKLDVRTGSALRGGTRLDRVTMKARIRDLTLVRHRTQSIRFPIRASESNIDIGLPAGYYRKVFVYVSSVTGITGFTIENTSSQGKDLVADLVAGQSIAAKPTDLNDIGTIFTFNNIAAKRTKITTDGTVPAGTYGVIQVEYWLDPSGDTSSSAVQRYANQPAYTIANLTPDRSFDADATSTAELADVVGTLIADLKIAGVLA